MKDLGKLSYFLGVSVMQTKNEVFQEQSAYTKALLSRFGMDNANSVATPVDVNADLVTTSDEVEECDKDFNQSAVGSLLYLSTRTRPDITFAVNNVAKYCSKPLKNHWTDVKRIFRYLKDTSELGFLYSNCSDECVGYSDADWAGDRSDRKSTSGYCFNLSNSVITWRSVKQSCVALSTAEAEYVALAGAAQEATWLKQLLDDLEFKTGGPMTPGGPALSSHRSVISALIAPTHLISALIALTHLIDALASLSHCSHLIDALASLFSLLSSLIVAFKS
ncbi:hypothetical protein FHG87_023045 [Trinorchestia longiramus]|nr:hypothetical protein FHG87_023045 [Trinorchestia longiramus]